MFRDGQRPERIQHIPSLRRCTTHILPASFYFAIALIGVDQVFMKEWVGLG